MGIPVASILILIFILWLQYEIRKGGKVSKKSLELFWLKENDSNLVRRKDISQLEYLAVTLDHLPMEDNADDTINSYRDTIKKYAERKMINLSGKTNTELKFEYGVANFNLLSSYDNNYTAFVSMLQKWAVRLKEHGYTIDAQAVLEFSIFSCLTDVTNAYRMLSEIYHYQNNSEKTDTLIEIINKTKIKDKDKLIKELKSITLRNK
jgi:hypothetical protein